MAQRQLLAARKNRAAVVAPDAGDAVEQLLLALALQRGDAQHLARIELERDVVEQRSAAQPAHLERWLGAVRRPRSPLATTTRPAADAAAAASAQHQLDDALLAVRVRSR